MGRGCSSEERERRGNSQVASPSAAPSGRGHDKDEAEEPQAQECQACEACTEFGFHPEGSHWKVCNHAVTGDIHLGAYQE